MRFFRNFAIENVRNGAKEGDGKAAEVKRKGNRLRETRKRRTEGGTFRGKSRRRDTNGMTLAGSPQGRNRWKEARGKPAEKKPTE